MTDERTLYGMPQRIAHDISDYIDLLWSKSRQRKAEEDQQNNRDGERANNASPSNS
jgi:hypothetical protein